jgi:hypothetical protein
LLIFFKRETQIDFSTIIAITAISTGDARFCTTLLTLEVESTRTV